jgi:hypothetical protein
MAEWELFKGNILDKIDSEFENIQSLILSGKIEKMYQLVDRSPNKVAKLLGLNYNSYHDKLRNPEKFTTLHVNTMAFAFRIDPDTIHNIIQKEITSKVVKKFARFSN